MKNLLPDLFCLMLISSPLAAQELSMQDTTAWNVLPGTALESRMNPNISRSLQGLLPGVDITFTDGKPTSTGSFSIRGGTPLFLVDGVPVIDFGGIDPLEIESVQVLKHTAATVLYGTRAAYGAIAVTTRKGRLGIHVQYDGTVGFSTMVPDWKNGLVTDGLAWTEAFYEAYANISRAPGSSSPAPTTINTISISLMDNSFLDVFRSRRKNSSDSSPFGESLGKQGQYLYFGSTNWVDLFYKDVTVGQRHHISLDAGSERIQARFSAGVFDNEGIYRVGDNRFRQMDLSGRIGVTPFPFLHLSGHARLQKRRNGEPYIPNNGNGLSSILASGIAQHGQPVFTPHNQDGTWTLNAAKSWYAAYAENNQYRHYDQLDFEAGAGLRVDLLRDLLYVKADYDHMARSLEFTHRYFPVSGYLRPEEETVFVSPEQQHITHTASSRVWNHGTAALYWMPRLGPDNTLSAIAGAERSIYDYRTDTHYSDYENERFNEGSEDQSESALTAFFVHADYRLLGRYGLSLTARHEKSSTFPGKEPAALFYGGLVSWDLTREKWMSWSSPIVNNWMLYSDFGENGIYQHASYTGDLGAGLQLERIRTLSIGSDIRLLNNRFRVNGEWYLRDWKDVIITQNAGAAVILGNDGWLQTRGWEISLGWQDHLSLGGSPFAYGALVQLWDSRTFVKKCPVPERDSYYPGKELGEIWGFRTDGYFLSNEEADAWVQDTFHKNGNNFKAFAGDLKFKDLNGNNQIDVSGTLDKQDDMEIIGNSSPRYRFGITLHVSWKGFCLETLLQGIGKQDWYYSGMDGGGLFFGLRDRPYGLYPVDQVGNTVEIDYSTENWTVVNADDHPYWTRLVGYAANRNQGPLTLPNDYYLQSLAYLRLKNLTLSYTLPAGWTQKIHIDRCKVYYSGENLLTISPVRRRNRLIDPEMDVKTTSYPVMTTHAFGISLAF